VVRQDVEKVGRIDIVVNNAGSAGPKQPLEQLPIDEADLSLLREAGKAESESVADAMRNILGVTWNVTRMAAPLLSPGASIINVSTIFSRTKYFGRTAYVVPKAALNAMSAIMAEELGARVVRVNTIYPGPIESDHIRTVFAAMDTMKGEPQGATADEFTDYMSLSRVSSSGKPEKSFPRPADVAGACVFLASDESAALNGHDIDVTNGMRVEKHSHATTIARPSLRVVDAGGMTVFIAAGNQVDDGLAIARIQSAIGADVILAFTLEGDVQQARSRMSDDDIDALFELRDLRANADAAEYLRGMNGHMDRSPDRLTNRMIATPIVGSSALSNRMVRKGIASSTCHPSSAMRPSLS